MKYEAEIGVYDNQVISDKTIDYWKQIYFVIFEHNVADNQGDNIHRI